MRLAAQERIQKPTIGIYRLVGRNDEAVTAGAYANLLDALLEQMGRSAFWRSKTHFTEARQQLEATESLLQGWDSYGAEPPNDVARTVAAQILDVLESAPLSPTRLAPSVEGGIAVSFVKGSNRAMIEIYNTGQIAAATYSDEGEPAVWELDPTDTQLQGAIEQIRVYLAS